MVQKFEPQGFWIISRQNSRLHSLAIKMVQKFELFRIFRKLSWEI